MDQAQRDPRLGVLELLLVEDDDGDALIVEEELALSGSPHTLVRARTLAEAQGSLGASTDCVLLDLALPDSHGLDGLRALRAAGDAAIVVLTGLDDEQRGAAALAEGAQDYLVKGTVDGQLLLRAVRYAVERRRAEHAAVALREAELTTRENERLQRRLLPRPIVHSGALEVATAYRPGRRSAVLGGDFFDVVQTGADCVHALIGDVSGHSADEAALGASLRIAWRTLIFNGAAPEEVLPTLDRVLAVERHADGVFATVATVAISLDRPSVRLSLAGHPPPLLLTPGTVTPLEAATALPLGLGLDRAWPSTDLPLEPGWSLLLYTDGLFEGRTGDGTGRLGTDGLHGLVDEANRAGDWRRDPQGTLDALITRVEGHNGGPLTDDVATVVLRS